MLAKLKEEVQKLLGNDDSGHGMDHLFRVESLALKFSLTEGGNQEVISAIAMLHDVDDYKLFGEENAKNLTNTKAILSQLDYSESTKEQILSEVSRIGYSKTLKGIRPQTLEGKIVSDADMSDVLGVMGILRCYQYSLKHQQPFFDPNLFPIQHHSYETYTTNKKNTVVNHLFEKILKLKNLMLTDAGKKEAEVRHHYVIEFLREFFRECEVPEWNEYLEKECNSLIR